MKDIVERKLKPVLLSLYERIKAEGTALELDGIEAYNPQAQFVGGMLINAASFIALELIGTEQALSELGGIIHMASEMEMKTWGILGSLNGLYRLHEKGLLEKTADEETLNKLRSMLDWRSFVDEENGYALTGLPTNYYGVAFNIAYMRERLGWDKEIHSTGLLQHLLQHIDRYSGTQAFMDETDGEGRFDRYSIVIPAELASTLLDAKAEVPEKIRKMLDRSAHLLLALANGQGYGISYGRSIGVYGDTAVLGVFTTAAKMGGILTKDELELAYGYSMKAMERVLDYWYDTDMQAINMWEHGRKTDNYRNKNRILSETLGIFLNLMSTYENWKRLGFENCKICPDFDKRLEKLEKYTYITFAEGEYKRGLAIIRDQKQVWSVPFIGGGEYYYDRDAYMPVPFSTEILQGVPEYSHGQLVPQLFMENGEIYMPLTYSDDITWEISEHAMQIVCRYKNLQCMGRGIYISEEQKYVGVSGKREKAEGIEAEVHYRFEKGRIHREDIFMLRPEVRVREIRLVFLTYSENPEIKDGAISFGKGKLTRIWTQGYDTCRIRPASEDGSHDTPQGRLKYEAEWKHKVTQQEPTLRYSWTIEYTENTM